MYQFLKLCWRDLWRNTRRTILTGLVMTFSVTLLIFSIALGDGGHDKMIRAATDSFLGHAQAQNPKWRDEPSLENILDAGQVDKVREAAKSTKGVIAVSPRISAGGLLSKKVPEPEDPNDLEGWLNMVSEGVVMLGVNPVDEAAVSNLDTSILKDEPALRCRSGCRAVRTEFRVENDCDALCAKSTNNFAGRECAEAASKACAGVCDPGDPDCDRTDCLARFADYCEPARFLAGDDGRPDQPWRGEVVLGSGLARVLDAGVGDLVAMTTGTARGRSFGSIYRIAGLVRTGSQEINRSFALTQIDKLAAGLEIPGGATQVVMAVDNLDRIDGIAKDLKKAVAGTGVKAMSWKEVAPELDVFMKIDQGSMMVMLVLMIMVVAVLLANVVIMAGMERTREYGIRLAMGESPDRISVGLIVETFMLAALSTALGLIIGEILVYVFTIVPLDWGMGEMETSGVVVDTVFNTKFSVYGPVFSVLIVWFFALVGALIPSFRIRKVRPVEAIRFV